MKDLKEKSCVITGAASGIGKSLATNLAQEGMRLYLADIDYPGLEALKAQLEHSGAEAHITRCDVSKRDDIHRLAADSIAALKDVDMLINNAGIGGAGLVEELEPADWEANLNVNLWSIIHAVQAFLPHMIERGSGHFVNVGSGAGIVGIPYHIQYVVSKFSVVGLSEALYSELCNAYPGINVSVICPFFLRTNIIDRSPIRIPTRLVPEEHREEVAARMGEFKKIFWDKYTADAAPVDVAVRKYVRGIKQNRLYIYDNFQVKIAQLIKGLPEPLYKWVLRSEEKRHIQLILDTFKEMGIKV